jgi:protein HIRA/HIR1
MDWVRINEAGLIGSGLMRLHCIYVFVRDLNFLVFNNCEKDYVDVFFRTVVCAACEDGSINMYSGTGSRLLPSIVLDSKVSKLHIKGFFVMAITQKAFLYIW